MPRESGPDEYPNFPMHPEAPLIPPNPDMTLENLYKAVTLMIDYMKRVEVFHARLVPFVGDFQRLDGLQNAQAGIQDLIEQRTDMLAGDITVLKVQEEELENWLKSNREDVQKFENEQTRHEDLISIDDGRIKSLEAEIANIKQKLSVIEFHVRRENFGTIQLEEPTEE